LVVCTQRQSHNPATISMGLPAPEQWFRRKVALEVLPQAIERNGEFPSLKQVALSYFAVPAMQNIVTTMQAIRVQIQVYGSFGWQFLTGLDYVRSTSDLDLRVEVPDHATACKVALALGSMQMPLRVDGELTFPNGGAIAWREYQQWVDGKVDCVLVKSRTSVQLLDPAVLQHGEVPCIN
jgi:phosphoribosyl-dephospho-CoA transferase